MRSFCLMFSLLLILQVALLGCAPQAEVMNHAKLADVSRIAVMPFTDGPGADGHNSGLAVTGFVMERFALNGKYSLVERSKLKDVLGEQELQAADLVDPSTAAKVGKMLGVQAVVVGSVSQYDMDKTIVYVHVVPVVNIKYRVGATLRIVDVENGEIIYANSASGISSNNYTEAGKQSAQKLLEPLLR